jgi:hypothetical protein
VLCELAGEEARVTGVVVIGGGGEAGVDGERLRRRKDVTICERNPKGARIAQRTMECRVLTC